LSEAGFQAHKWCSSSEGTLQDVPADLRESSANWNIDTNNTIKALRLEWNPASDELQFVAPTSASVSTKQYCQQ